MLISDVTKSSQLHNLPHENLTKIYYDCDSGGLDEHHQLIQRFEDKNFISILWTQCLCCRYLDLNSDFEAYGYLRQSSNDQRWI